MPKVLDEDQLRRKKALEERRAARKAAAAEKEQANSSSGNTAAGGAGAGSSKVKSQRAASRTANNNNSSNRDDSDSLNNNSNNSIINALPEVALHYVCAELTAAELGRFTMTCKFLNQKVLPEARIQYLLARLSQSSSCCSNTFVGMKHNCNPTTLINSPAEARQVIKDALITNNNKNDTGRILPRGKYAKTTCNEFISYARFIEQVVSGYSTIKIYNNNTKNIPCVVLLPKFVQSRMASLSPEHTLCRVGGDGFVSGAGGSGVASWGVGRRGQLGHGLRQDERIPKRLNSSLPEIPGSSYNSSSHSSSKIPNSLGYGVTIVQVSAGGGLVRVAHSLLLTNTGHVLSFGTGQYGALGHGYSAAKQLPDALRPRYIASLMHLTCTVVAAGELHSAVVTNDGDVYTWGDGFCGQLGHGDKRPQVSPKQVRKGGLDEECVANITCGGRHTIAVTEDDGLVYSWGLGFFGVLGRSYTPFEYDAEAAIRGFAGDNANNNNANGNANNNAEALEQQAAAVAVAAAEVVLNNDNGNNVAAAPPIRDHAAELAAHLDLMANLTLDDSSNQCIPVQIDALRDIFIVGASAGHRHSLVLDKHGSLYSFGAGIAGCLGHGDTLSQMYPVKIMALAEENVRIRQFSAGVDMSMAVSTTGDVYSWGRTDGGRIGLSSGSGNDNRRATGGHYVTLPRQVQLKRPDDGRKILAVDVECGYVHSLIVALDGSIHVCGNVGVEGEDDGQDIGDNDENYSLAGRPRMVPNFNIWHRLDEPHEEQVKKERWKKFGKYEVKGRSKMLTSDTT